MGRRGECDRNQIGPALDAQVKGRGGFKEEVIRCSERSSKMKAETNGFRNVDVTVTLT